MDTWPTETDLLVVPGTNRVTLSVQLPTMRLVLQDTFEFVRASLLFSEAFLNHTATLAHIKSALIDAAEGQLPGAFDIHRRLLDDDAYLIQMSCLVHLPASVCM